MPYMIQVIALGNVNKYAFMCLKDELHRNIRVRQVFARENRLAALSTNSTTAPEGTYFLYFVVVVVAVFVGVVVVVVTAVTGGKAIMVPSHQRVTPFLVFFAWKKIKLTPVP